ncbi:Putative LOC100121651, partial [Caligus rogercresseyi]
MKPLVLQKRKCSKGSIRTTKRVCMRRYRAIYRSLAAATTIRSLPPQGAIITTTTNNGGVDKSSSSSLLSSSSASSSSTSSRDEPKSPSPKENWPNLRTNGGGGPNLSSNELENMNHRI